VVGVYLVGSDCGDLGAAADSVAMGDDTALIGAVVGYLMGLVVGLRVGRGSGRGCLGAVVGLDRGEGKLRVKVRGILSIVGKHYIDFEHQRASAQWVGHIPALYEGRHTCSNLSVHQARNGCFLTSFM
jgi:hypothetical protein